MQNSLLKIKVISGTTDQHGNMQLFSLDDRFIISIYSTNVDCVVIPLLSGNSWYAKIREGGSNMSNVANMKITVKCLYTGSLVE